MKKCKNKILMLLAAGMTLAITSSAAYSSEHLFKSEGNIRKAIAYDNGKSVLDIYDSNNSHKLYFNDNGYLSLVNDYNKYSLNSMTKYSQKYIQLSHGGSNYLLNLYDGNIDSSTSIEQKADDAKAKTVYEGLSGDALGIGFSNSDVKKPRAFEKIGTGQFDNTLYLYGVMPMEGEKSVISFKLSDCTFESHYAPSNPRYTSSSWSYYYTFLGTRCSAPKDDSEETRIAELNSNLRPLGFENVTKDVDSNGNVILVSYSTGPMNYARMSYDKSTSYYNNVNPYSPYHILSYASVIYNGKTSDYYGPDFVGFTDENGNYSSTYSIASSAPSPNPVECRPLYHSIVVSEDKDNLYSMTSSKIDKVSKSSEKTYDYIVTKSKLYEPSYVTSYKINDENITSLINSCDYNSLSKCPCRVIDGKLYFTSISNDGTKVKVSVVKLVDNGQNSSAVLENSVEHPIDSFNFNDSANTTDNKAYENTSVAIDNNGYTWIIYEGKIYKFDGTSFNETFECDSSLDRLDVYDDNDLIAYSSEGNGYASLMDGIKDGDDENHFTSDGIKYEKNDDGTVSICGFSYNIAENVTLSDKVSFNGESYDVTSIKDCAFNKCTKIRNLTINDDIKIGESAFAGCSSLETVTLPDSLKNIANCAFQGCSSLLQVNLGNGLESIGQYSFAECPSLKEINLPDSLQNINNGAFWNCTGLQNIAVPDNAATIGNAVFAGCSSLVSAKLPDSIEAVPESTFSGCTSLNDFVIPDKVKTINNCAFEDCSSLTSINFPETLESIGMFAFMNCTSLEKAVIPDSVTYIGDGMFYKCENLTDVKLSENIDAINTGLFSECKSLNNITIPEGVKSIGKWAFMHCDNITEAVIPDSVTNMSECCFADCTNLEKVQLSENIDSIGDSDFAQCKKLSEINIPSKVKSIGNCAFEGCESLTSAALPYSLENIAQFVFKDCINLENIALPENLTSIGTGAFWRCSSITDIKIPDSVTEMDKCAFAECTDLKDVSLSENIESLEDSVFTGCTSLESIIIPDNIKTLGDNTFNGCTSLKEITLPDNLESIKNFSFMGCTAIKDITIPESVSNIGSGTFWNCTSLKEAVIKGNVDSIGDYTFANCSSLAELTLAGDINKVSSCAFSWSNTDNIKATVISDKVKNLLIDAGIKEENITVDESLSTASDSVFSDAASEEASNKQTSEETSAIISETETSDILNPESTAEAAADTVTKTESDASDSNSSISTSEQATLDSKDDPAETV